ncbi:hypothetical protein V1281_007750 [Nitrobacteraceae bacterium AZCC 2161]
MRFPQITLSSLALVVSVGVNLFVAGWLVGDRAGYRGPPPPPPPGSMQPFLASLEGTLSPGGARIMDTMVRGLQGRGPLFRRFEDLGERMQKALVGERFDRAAFLAAAQELSAEQSADRMAVAEEIANAMEKLSPEDRKHLAEMRPDHGFGGGIFRYLPGANFPGPRR